MGKREEGGGFLPVVFGDRRRSGGIYERKKFHVSRLFRADESWGKVYARLFSARCYL